MHSITQQAHCSTPHEVASRCQGHPHTAITSLLGNTLHMCFMCTRTMKIHYVAAAAEDQPPTVPPLLALLEAVEVLVLDGFGAFGHCLGSSKGHAA